MFHKTNVLIGTYKLTGFWSCLQMKLSVNKGEGLRNGKINLGISFFNVLEIFLTPSR